MNAKMPKRNIKKNRDDAVMHRLYTIILIKKLAQLEDYRECISNLNGAVTLFARLPFWRA